MRPMPSQLAQIQARSGIPRRENKTGMEPPLMDLKVLLPYRVFAEKQFVSRIVVETYAGSFGLLPHRLDCTAALSPGILVYHTRDEGEAYVAIDQGVLIKTGLQVVISV